MYYPYKVVVIVYLDSDHEETVEGFGIKEDRYIWANTAKRLVREKLNFEPGYLTALEDERIPVESVSPEIRKTWPLGLKTIPVYKYSYHK